MAELKTWKEIPIGGLTEAGSSTRFLTGNWRVERPILNTEKCINCLLCWVVCPDMSIVVEDGKVTGMDLDYCKGCGACAAICPVKAITMEPETKFQR